MANITVTDVTGSFLANAASISANVEASKQMNSVASDFSKSLSDAEQTVKNTGSKNDVAAVSGAAKVDKTGAKELKSDNTEKKDPLNNPEDCKEVAKDIVKKADDVKGKIKDTLGLSDEEINEAMESLGLTFQDLLQPDKLQDLLMSLTQTTDSMSLLTNADLYSDIKDIMNFAAEAVNDILSEHGITSDELLPILERDDFLANVQMELSSVNSESDEALETLEIEETNVVDIKDVNENNQAGSPDNADGSTVTYSESVDTQADTKVQVIENVSTEEGLEISQAAGAKDATEPKVENVAANDTGKQAGVEEASDDSKTETFVKASKAQTDPNKGRNEGFERGSEFAKNDNEAFDWSKDAASTVQTTVNAQTEVNSVGDVIEKITTYTSNDASEIVSQVTESIKVNISSDVTSMEMQLHPASLGAVNMQISSTNGVVSAQILVENEAVKTALESQLVTLLETFEEQGQKVEAVEVSVANYDLNKGMDQNSNERGNNSKEQRDAFKVMGASRRRINLSILSDEEEAELSEEERITKDMMERNGNSVDYTV